MGARHARRVGLGPTARFGRREVGRDYAAYDETVVDKRRRTETIVDEKAHWQRYSLGCGPHQGDDTPAFPSSAWQPNIKSDPHHDGREGPYFRSNGGAGNGDWFYLDLLGGRDPHDRAPGGDSRRAPPAVTHQEFRYERQVTTQSHTEYRWSVYERTYTLGEPAVEDDRPGRP